MDPMLSATLQIHPSPTQISNIDVFRFVESASIRKVGSTYIQKLGVFTPIFSPQAGHHFWFNSLTHDEFSDACICDDDHWWVRASRWETEEVMWAFGREDQVSTLLQSGWIRFVYVFESIPQNIMSTMMSSLALQCRDSCFHVDARVHCASSSWSRMLAPAKVSLSQFVLPSFLPSFPAQLLVQIVSMEEE